MRLRKIKLAGFKSFVDPTTIELPGDLIGIVGPNGCGKSNVIDAVRWVMGEISARHLRGESMADVVFSGSSARKPIGQASVELVFDNSDGRLGDRYAAYSEVSVRRLVARDAPQSSYFLNGVRCRRRDVTDLFMGTGLGPRSYAIIEQGMISRLIEAKPEELREFLEEAAGISKYKERRRETENRIAHTEENIARLNDLRDELGRRLEHLKRQAAAAERYKALKAEERQVRAELLGLRWRSLDAGVRREASQVTRQETALEAALAALRRVEAELEAKRAEHGGASDEFNGLYRRVLDAGAEIARIEESIQHLRSRRAELGESLERERAELEEARSHLTSEEEKLAELGEALVVEEPALERLRAEESASREAFARAESAMEQAQAAWEALNARAARPSELAHAERARVEHLGERLERVRARMARLESERASLAPEELGRALEGLEREAGEARASAGRLGAALAEAEQAIEGSRQALSEGATRLHAARERCEQLRGRLASLEALQQDALGRRPGEVSEWLAARGLEGAPRLGERLRVEQGWEQALEAALAWQLEAVCIERADGLWPALGLLERGALGLLETGRPLGRSRSHGTELAGARPLAERVQGPEGVAGLLAGVYTAQSAEEALSVRERLGAGESVITAEGLWLGPNWARVVRPEAAEASVLLREQALRALNAELDAAGAEVARLSGEHEAMRGAVRARELEAARLREDFAAAQQRLARLESQLGARCAELDEARRRMAAIAGELRELDERASETEAALDSARGRLAEAEAQMAAIAAERAAREREREACRQALEAARERWQRVREEVYASGVRAETARARIGSLEASVARNRDQLQGFERRSAELETALEAIAAPLAEAEQRLAGKLSARRELETTLDAARERVETIEQALRELEQARTRAEKSVDDERSALEQLRMRAQETLVRRRTLEETLAESGASLEAVLAALPEEAEEGEWAARLDGVEGRIARLGAINLAAIEEHDEQAERKAYLDRQHADLSEALDTLREAIRKIDRETRVRFKDTFEQVNAGLADTFPRLFGGGTAFLQMTGEDLLDTGVTVMARPPGKRNTSIHMLSGGEKALTAIALVFAIFELNPAPFCLLDEVDAPLDDANVGRFCELVKSMTERVQFVLVTHNKTTMEMAQQLIGVTMNEPGISRLVAVDIEEAMELAAV